jgi:hypothetical protein
MIQNVQSLAEHLEVDITIFSEWSNSTQPVIGFHFRVESPRRGESNECGPYSDLGACVEELNRYLLDLEIGDR